MKTVGVIGGLGPETTAGFYLDIIFSCQKLNKTNRPPVVISSVPLPYKLEENAIVNNFGLQKFIPYLVAEAQRLEKAKADFIVMPCNSLHLFIEDIKNSVDIPVLSIVEETVKFLQKKGMTKVGIISTAITAQHKLYESELAKKKITHFAPNENDQSKLNQIIHRLIIGKKTKSDRDQLLQVIKKFKSADCVVLACTDLQLLRPDQSNTKIFDTMKILSDATVKNILKE